MILCSSRAYASVTSLEPDQVDGETSWPSPWRHLYVVLDQMKTGYGIYKLNVDDLDGGDEEALTTGAHPGVAAAQRGSPPSGFLLHRLDDTL